MAVKMLSFLVWLGGFMGPMNSIATCCIGAETAGQCFLSMPSVQLHVLESLTPVDIVNDIVVQSGPPVERLNDIDGEVLTGWTNLCAVCWTSSMRKARMMTGNLVTMHLRCRM